MIKKIVACAILCILCLVSYMWASPASYAREDMSISGIFSEGSDAVVMVEAPINKKNASFGSGFIIHPNGLIVTNYHVIEKAKEIFVKLKNNKRYAGANLVNFDAGKDIALIKINATGLKTVVMGNSDNVKIGEKVVTIGNPLGLESTISDGLISAVRTVENGRKLLQTSVPLSNGSSGSPLFNLKGEVIGVNVAGRANGQNLNFAIPINSVRSLMLGSGYRETGSGSYIVKSKDTLYSIARIFNTTPKKIMELNNLPDSKIAVGSRLKLPAHR